MLELLPRNYVQPETPWVPEQCEQKQDTLETKKSTPDSNSDCLLLTLESVRPHLGEMRE